MGRLIALLYGVVAYAIFFITFLYAIGFVGNLAVLKSIDSGTPGPVGTALLINALLLGLFAIQHSVMARVWFKERWTRVVPKPVERSTYVLLASLLLALLFWGWRPLSGDVWSVQSPAGSLILWILFWAGWVLVLLSTFVIDHFDLFGLRQVWLYFRGREYRDPEFKVTTLYRYVRHPLLLGFLIAFWSTPRMSVGHLEFAVVITLYVLLAIQFEERDLVASHGDAYARYRESVRMLIPLPRRRAKEAPAPADGGAAGATAESAEVSFESAAPPTAAPADAPDAPADAGDEPREGGYL